MIKQFACAAIFAGLVCGGYAQIPNDVGAQISGQLTTYKSKKGAAQAKVVAIATYFAPSVAPSALRKAKASGTLTFLISNDKKLSADDVVFATKNLKLKAFAPKFVKVKANLSSADKGKYMLCVTDSPQDEYMANNVDSFYIAYDAF